MTSVVVTGARGFVGKWIVDGLLRRGCRVDAVTSDPAGLRDERPNLRWHNLDLMDRGEVARFFNDTKPELLVHAAWETEHGAFWTSNRNFGWVTSTLDLIRAHHAGGGRRVLAVGSCAEYAWRHGVCIEGETPLEPAHLYGACKHAAHVMSASFAAQNGMDLCWARIFNPYGPGENPRRLVPSIVRAILTGEKARCTDGLQVRDLIHTADCGDAIAHLALSKLTGAVNVGSGTQGPIRDVARMIADQLGRPELLALGALPRRPEEPLVLVPELRRLFDEAGWTPRRTLEEGIGEVIDSVRQDLERLA